MVDQPDLPASGGWYVVPVASGVLKLENMDLMMDAAGDGCDVVIVGLWVRVWCGTETANLLRQPIS